MTNGRGDDSQQIIRGIARVISIAARESMDKTVKTWTNGQVVNEEKSAKI